MDVDISDILASVTNSTHRSSYPSHTTSDTSVQSDHHLLTRCWISERTSPTLQPYPTTLLFRTLLRIQAQITRIEDLASGMSTPTPTSLSSSTSNQNANLTLSILQTDLSRTQFLLRSLLRQRLSKISKHAGYYLHQLSLDQKTALLSPSEVQFLRHHQALLGEYYSASFLGGLPAGLRRLDEKSAGGDMVEGPDEGVGVVVRGLGEVWETGEEDSGLELRMRRGEVWVVRWEDVKAGVEKGELELLVHHDGFDDFSTKKALIVTILSGIGLQPANKEVPGLPRVQDVNVAVFSVYTFLSMVKLYRDRDQHAYDEQDQMSRDATKTTEIEHKNEKSYAWTGSETGRREST